MSTSIMQDWITSNQQTEELVKDLSFVAYPYSKYGKTILALKIPGCIWNIPIANISENLHDGTYGGYEKTRSFAEYLSERMALALNLFKGKNNDEIVPEVDITWEDFLKISGIKDMTVTTIRTPVEENKYGQTEIVFEKDGYVFASNHHGMVPLLSQCPYSLMLKIYKAKEKGKTSTAL